MKEEEKKLHPNQELAQRYVNATKDLTIEEIELRWGGHYEGIFISGMIAMIRTLQEKDTTPPIYTDLWVSLRDSPERTRWGICELNLNGSSRYRWYLPGEQRYVKYEDVIRWGRSNREKV